MVPAASVAEETLPLLTTYCAAPPLVSPQLTLIEPELVAVAVTLPGRVSGIEPQFPSLTWSTCW